MIAIEIRVNGKKQCLAGIADGTVDAHVFCTGRRHWRRDPKSYQCLFLSGVDKKRDEHLDWMKCDLAVGDEVVLRFVRASKIDLPAKRSRMTSRQAKEGFVRHMAKELGWKIQTK